MMIVVVIRVVLCVKRGAKPAAAQAAITSSKYREPCSRVPIIQDSDFKRCKLRALAVTTATRSDALPEVPTVGEFVPGYEASGWNGIGAPRNTPIEIVQKLNREINAGLADAGIRAKFAALGGMLLAGSPADFGGLIAEDTEKWAKVIRAANIKPE
jgi:tripartite-type tricarboxylate transporter receptor subunit TctC